MYNDYMSEFLIRFKIIDVISDTPTYMEQTIYIADNQEDAIRNFRADTENAWIASVEKVEWDEDIDANDSI